MFKNPFSFNGRIRRLEYGLSYIVYFLGAFVVGVLLAILDITGIWTYEEGRNGDLVVGLLCIPIFWFMIAQGAKRCHDRDNSGWWMLVPFYGFWMLFASGDIGVNQYGPNPKGLNYDYNDSVGENGAISPIDDVDEDGIIKE
jgi:uncharacterized membrane protein YhaH (DUF805 family)